MTEWMDHIHKQILPNKICNRTLNIGVVGFSDETKMSDMNEYRLELSMLLMEMVDKLESIHGKCGTFAIVSGLTNVGVPKLAYEYCSNKNTKLTFSKSVGIACSKAIEFDTFPVDEKHIIGNNWGDESEFFINHIDGLIRLGGGKQSHSEVNLFKSRFPDAPVLEYDI